MDERKESMQAAEEAIAAENRNGGAGKGGLTGTFWALAAAQVVSLFGNAVLRFALPLHVLSVTGSSVAMGVVTACAWVPYIVLAPIGGVAADRIRKRLIMATLDTVMAFVCAAYLLLSGTVDVVGAPVVITQVLGLSAQLLGLADGALALGGLAGGIVAGALAGRLGLSSSPAVLAAGSLALLLVAAACAAPLPPMGSYSLVVVGLFLTMACCTLFSVQAIAFVQGEIPKSLIGKVMALVMALANCATPLGALAYGWLLDAFRNDISVVVVGVVAISLILSLADAEALPFSEEFFNAVWCNDSFHHYPDPKRAAFETWRVLKPGGSLIIGDVWQPAPARALMNAWMPYSQEGDVRIYSENEMRTILGTWFDTVEWRKVNSTACICIARKGQCDEDVQSGYLTLNSPLSERIVRY